MDFETMLRSMADRNIGNDTPLTTAADLSPFITYFDGRTFSPGTWVQKRSDGRDSDEGGLCNYRFPRRGEPAYVLDVLPNTNKDSNGYENETHVILVMYEGKKPVRMVVDPVHFERYELPGEKLLREIESSEGKA